MWPQGGCNNCALSRTHPNYPIDGLANRAARTFCPCSLLSVTRSSVTTCERSSPAKRLSALIMARRPRKAPGRPRSAPLGEDEGGDSARSDMNFRPALCGKDHGKPLRSAETGRVAMRLRVYDDVAECMRQRTMVYGRRRLWLSPYDEVQAQASLVVMGKEFEWMGSGQGHS